MERFLQIFPILSFHEQSHALVLFFKIKYRNLSVTMGLFISLRLSRGDVIGNLYQKSAINPMRIEVILTVCRVMNMHFKKHFSFGSSVRVPFMAAANVPGNISEIRV